MNKNEALEYCYKNRNKFISDAFKMNEDGNRQFDCLVSLIEDGTISPEELKDYGMEYDT